MTLALARLTRWPRSEILGMTFDEACIWLADAVDLENRING